jgi:hypothetical protein
MPSIQVECSSCDGSGLYCGFAEPEGTAVVCHGCGGTGATTLTYKKFTHRKKKRGVRKVMGNSPWFTRSQEDYAKTISYKEFEDAVAPAVPED